MTNLNETKRKFWIQRADFSCEDFDPVVLRIAKVIIAGYDWAEELEYLLELEEHGLETCSPGIGFVAGDAEHTLHICPTGDGEAACFYMQLKEQGSKEKKNWTSENVSESLQNKFLELFYTEQYQSLISILNEE
ncbi:MAG: hypothetical protein DHS20C07_04470 [Methyloligella sp.]|nr:MAG: hypothetical protein DHS20C07_04470 [Methyloligella sp.]